MSQIKEKQSAHFWNVYYLTTKCVLFLDTTDHPTTIRKLAKSREKKRIHKTQHRRKRAEILKHSLFFKKKENSIPIFLKILSTQKLKKVFSLFFPKKQKSKKIAHPSLTILLEILKIFLPLLV